MLLFRLYIARADIPATYAAKSGIGQYYLMHEDIIEVWIDQKNPIVGILQWDFCK